MYGAGTTWHITALAMAAAILFVIGFIPAIVEIWSRRGRVAGISFGFLAIDVMGALFSLASLGSPLISARSCQLQYANLPSAFQQEFDLQGGSLYLLVVIIEFGIAGNHVIWLWRTRHLHHRAKVLGVTFDDLPEAIRYQRPEDKAIKEPEEAPILIQNGDPGYGSVGCVSVNSENSHRRPNR